MQTPFSRVAGESPGVPAYARVSLSPLGLSVPHDDAWAAIVFYRQVACVPSGFNLLTFFDVPRVFGCPMTVAGHEIWEHGPGVDPAPVQAFTRDAGPVPVWFVSWAELQAAAADGVLTIGELAALPSLLTGTATWYHEMLQPEQRALIQARGTLSDGRPFTVHALCQCAQQRQRARITIG